MDEVTKSKIFGIGEDYVGFLREVKERVHSAQIKAALSVNAALISMYWELGKRIVMQQEQYSWGSEFMNQLAQDLSSAFPEMKGFSRANLYRIRKFFLFYQRDEKVAQAARQIPWGHNIWIIERVSNAEQALWYVR